ncbi:trichohyalin-like [Ruditapes philippinarum]|uniref:trichohyalin-like n=1 Tax=Ruditapes philippinarum TaxID=129788 RepID=UPI00295A64E3|nr:trichohyalin-like [Ruditapes philippinarum]
MLDKTLGELREEREGSRGGIEEQLRTSSKRITYRKEKVKSIEYEDDLSNTSTTQLKRYRKDQSEMNLSTRLNEIKNENEEIRSQSSSVERESLKLRKLQEIEKKKNRLFIENQSRLEAEIENKRRAERELSERIKLLESQEADLNMKRNENERLERLMLVKKKEDEALRMKLKLLSEKEKLLKDRVETGIDEIRKRTAKQRGNDIFVDENEILRRDERDVTRTFEEPHVPDGVGMTELDNKIGFNDGKYRQKKEDFPLFKVGQPKIPHFNGSHFEQWRMEISCLVESMMYPDYALVVGANGYLSIASSSFEFDVEFIISCSNYYYLRYCTQ